MATALGTIQSAWQSITTKVGDLIEDIPNEWRAALENLRASVRNFSSAYGDLQKYSAVSAKAPPALKAQYQSAMRDGARLQTVIVDTLRNIGNALNVLQSESMNGLGYVWLIPSISIAAIGAITYSLNNYVDNVNQLKIRMATLDAAVKAGATPKQLLEHDEKLPATPAGITDNIKMIGQYALIGAILWFAYPFIKKALK